MGGRKSKNGGIESTGEFPQSASSGLEPTRPATSGVSTPKAGVSRPKGSDRLTDRECNGASADDTPRKLADGKGLYLLVNPGADGSKLWRLKYRHGGKERVYSIGAYPETSLAGARDERDKARNWLRDGKDPVIERRLLKASEAAKQADTFELVAREFLEKQAGKWSADHAAAVKRRLEAELLPDLGRLPVSGISAPIALATLKKIEKRGALETASKSRVLGSQIARYAIVTGRMAVDPFAHLSEVMQTRRAVNRATIPLEEMPALFAALAKVPAEANTRSALYWLVLTVTRTIETRMAPWAEIDAKAKLWRIPAARMKMRDPHIVPLSTHALRVLELARPLRTSSDPGALIFPGFTRAGNLSENAILALLARAGFYGRQTGHGFRASFSTWANETHAADPDVIEACLAHKPAGVRHDYNHATYLAQRRKVLQAWADQCEAWGMRL